MKAIISRIHRYIPKECMVELNAIRGDVTISDNNTKADMIRETLEKYNVPFRELGPGTNRYAVRIDGYVFKIAMDNDGINDNRIEFTMSDELQPYVAKTYECNGLIIVSEYVTVISRSEFEDNEEVIKQILGILAERYIFGDVGTIKKNFLNWGYRADGTLVILDYGYIYKVRGEEARCTHLLSDDVVCGTFLEYDSNFNNLICPHCRTKYRYDDIRRRIDLEFEKRRVDAEMKKAYCLSSESMDIEDEDDIENIRKEDDEDMYEMREYTEEEREDLFIKALEHINDHPISTDTTSTDSADSDHWYPLYTQDEEPEEDPVDECEYMDVLFDLVEVYGTKMLYIDERITSEDNIPEDFDILHIRHSDNGFDDWSTIEHNVFTAFAGSLIVASVLEFGNDVETIDVSSHLADFFTGKKMTMLEYRNMIAADLEDDEDDEEDDSYIGFDEDDEDDDSYIGLDDDDDDDSDDDDDDDRYANMEDDKDDFEEDPEDQDIPDDDIPTKEELMAKFVNNTIPIDNPNNDIAFEKPDAVQGIVDAEFDDTETTDDSEESDTGETITLKVDPNQEYKAIPFGDLSEEGLAEWAKMEASLPKLSDEAKSEVFGSYVAGCIEDSEQDTTSDTGDSGIGVSWIEPKTEADSNAALREELQKIADAYDDDDDDESQYRQSKAYKHRKNYR